MATKKITEVDVVNSLSDSDTIFVNSSNSLKQISKSNLVIKGDTENPPTSTPWRAAIPAPRQSSRQNWQRRSLLIPTP